jgi:hypothetical protein
MGLIAPRYGVISASTIYGIRTTEGVNVITTFATINQVKEDRPSIVVKSTIYCIPARPAVNCVEATTTKNLIITT